MSAALRRQRAQRLQHLVDGVGRMGVVHHRQRRARQADALHAAGHGGQVGAGGHRIRQRHAQRPQRAQHAHQVVDVVVTHQRGADGDALGALAHHPLQALVGVADVGGPQACIAPAGHGPGVQPARLGLGHQFAGAWVVGLNHRRPQAGPVEQGGLGLPVGLHAAVVVEVILREIGEHGDADGGAVQAPLGDADGRGLDGAGAHPRVHQLAKAPLQQHRIGGGHAGGLQRPWQTHTQGTHQRARGKRRQLRFR